jgi:hypothetical protein
MPRFLSNWINDLFTTGASKTFEALAVAKIAVGI